MISGAVSVKRKNTSLPLVQLHAPVVSLRAAVVFAVSVCDGLERSIVVAPARVSFAGGIPMQRPAVHEVPMGQTVPQAPQLAALV